MSIGAERPNIRVFLSYRRMDNPKQGAFPGKVSAFRDDLENAIAREIGHRHVQVFMDTDPEKLIGGRSWRDKILQELSQTTVFVSIMTANYLDSESKHACAWEFREYGKVYQSNPDRHSLITIQLCPPEVVADALSQPDWEALGSQEIFSYSRSRTAWRDGQGHATWDNLIGDVSDAIIAFARKAATVASAPVTHVVPTPDEEQPAEPEEHPEEAVSSIEFDVVEAPPAPSEEAISESPSAPTLDSPQHREDVIGPNKPVKDESSSQTRPAPAKRRSTKLTIGEVFLTHQPTEGELVGWMSDPPLADEAKLSTEWYLSTKDMIGPKVFNKTS
ncbi:MAG: toll/interleukin-1 receptor domain-containing protein, partial [Propionibacteriaceae bacterium]|nr:toll/interleukin-1 receptor domain-containing protein [Propionibacteriaceae bacterium]